MALLHFWRTQALPSFGGSMGVATVDHGLRGEESRRDVQWVAGTCIKYDVPFHVHHCQPAGKPNRLSWEMWGRQQRYAFFQKLREEHGYQWVLTAHHQLDQLETLLLRVERGTGLQGLQGIHFQRDRVIRPFLNRSPGELREYALGENLSWREDASNTDINIPRNWHRHKYIPQSIGSKPEILESATRLSLAMQDLWPRLSQWAGAQIHWSEEREGWALSREAVEFLFDWHPWVGEAALSRLARKAGLVLGGKSRKKILEVLNKRQNICLTLRGGGFFYLENGGVCVARKAVPKVIPEPVSLHWTKKRELQILPFQWMGESYRCKLLWREQRSPVEPPKKRRSKRVLLDAGSLSGVLNIRARRAGDRFSPLGTVSCRRKLKDYFNGIKLPAKKRDQQMLMCDGDRIAWLVGWEISENYKIRPETREFLELEIECQS